MTEKLVKGRTRQRRHPRDAQSSKNAAWRENISPGMRRAKLRRREMGLMTFTEVAVELGLSKRAVESLFAPVPAGPRNYIKRADVDRWKGETGANAA
jgi:transposase